MTPAERIAARQRELAELRRQDIRRFEATVPLAWRAHYLLTKGRRASIHEAVKLRCLICMFYDDDAVAGCSRFACPLHSFRPFSGGPVEGVLEQPHGVKQVGGAEGGQP